MRLLFVCTGNTCRSPMAAFFAKNEIHQRGLDWEADSAGIYAGAGQPIAALAADALTRRQVPLQVHKSKPITQELVDSADVIIAMTAGHVGDLVWRFPSAKAKVHLMGQFIKAASSKIGTECDIVDPFGGSDVEYEACASQLQQAVVNLIELLSAKGSIE